MTNTSYKHATIIAIIIGSIIAIFFIEPIPQDPNYHQFADTRSLFSIPNAGDVLSNIGFLIVSLLAFKQVFTKGFQRAVPNLNKVYLTLFLGIFFTAFGSAYYHLDPNNQTLVWDRLPMTIAFMAFFTMIIGEQVSDELARTVFGPLIIFGIFSVAYWHYTEQKGLGDLRIYVLVQFLPLILIPLMLLMYKSPFSTTVPIWLAIGFYALAKIFELFDEQIYQSGIAISGHSIKHLMAAIGTGAIYWRLK